MGKIFHMHLPRLKKLVIWGTIEQWISHLYFENKYNFTRSKSMCTCDLVVF